MGAGGLAVDAMAIGCLGVERRVERFFSYLAIFTPEYNLVFNNRIVDCTKLEPPGREEKR